MLLLDIRYEEIQLEFLAVRRSLVALHAKIWPIVQYFILCLAKARLNYLSALKSGQVEGSEANIGCVLVLLIRPSRFPRAYIVLATQVANKRHSLLPSKI